MKIRKGHYSTVSEPFFVFGSKLAFWGISCNKTLTYPGDERWMLPCGNQYHFVDNFTFESISLELFAFGRVCSEVFTGRRPGLWLNNSSLVWDMENDAITSCEKQDTGGHLPAPSYLLARPRRWEQRSFCWAPKARSCHSKESWHDHFGFELSLQRADLTTLVL